MKLYPYFLLALVKTVTDNYNKINVMKRTPKKLIVYGYGGKER